MHLTLQNLSGKEVNGQEWTKSEKEVLIANLILVLAVDSKVTLGFSE